MVPHLALFFCYGLIAWLFWKDVQWRKVGSKALLVPGVWLGITGSRPISYWFGGSGGSDANPIDTLAYLSLIIAAAWILYRRRFKWLQFAKKNKAQLFLYGYLLLTVLWSLLPGTSCKRIIKDFGCVLSGLVILTEVDPAVAVRSVYVRVSYILFPLSIVFIKFFPNIGRSFSRAGEAMFGGVTTQKNSLGQTVFVFGLIVFWDLLELLKEEKPRRNRMQIGIRAVLILMGLWLLQMCDSQTSLLCFIVGAAILWGSQRLLKMRNGRKVLITILASIVLIALMDKTLGVSNMIIRSLGRDPDLTGRTDIWRLVLDQKTPPLTGEGFYVFWDSPKGKEVIESFMKVNSAHNGYLDLYVDGGLVGCALLCVFLIAAGRRAMDRLFSGHPLGKVALCFWFLAILYNFSESSFLRLDVLWFSLLLVVAASPLTKRQRLAQEQARHKLAAQGMAYSYS